MVHKPISIMILPLLLALTGVLTLAVLTAISSNNNHALAEESNTTGFGLQQPPTNNTGFGQPTQNNNTAPSFGQPTQNSSGNATVVDAKSILAVHNSERAAVGVPALVWNDKLAAGAKAWAEHLATTGEFAHSTCCGAFRDYGENIAGYNTDVAQGVQLWIDEKNHYNGGPLPPDTPGSGPQAIGHYTQMVWRTTTSVGCGTASGSGHPFSILVCQYSPPGNIFGQKPY